MQHNSIMCVETAIENKNGGYKLVRALFASSASVIGLRCTLRCTEISYSGLALKCYSLYSTIARNIYFGQSS